MGLFSKIGKMFGMDATNVKVKKIKEPVIHDGMMASAYMSDAVTRLKTANEPTKVLMIQDDIYIQEVSDYAFKLAQRLDCDIIALSITDKPLKYDGLRKERETNRFMDAVQENLKDFLLKTENAGIKVQQIVEIGNQEDVVYNLSSNEKGIRYVLTRPEEKDLVQNNKHIPVYDIKCSRFRPSVRM